MRVALEQLATQEYRSLHAQILVLLRDVLAQRQAGSTPERETTGAPEPPS